MYPSYSVSGNIRFMRIFAGFLDRVSNDSGGGGGGGVKNERQFSVLLVAKTRYVFGISRDETNVNAVLPSSVSTDPKTCDLA